MTRRISLLLCAILLLAALPAHAGRPVSPPGETLASSRQDLLAALAPYAAMPVRPPIVMVHGWQGVNFDKPDCERPTDPQWADDNWGTLDEDIEALGFHVNFALLKSGSSFDEPNCTPVAEENAPYVAEAIDQSLAETGQPKVILVAHSMGGLVSRAYLESDLYRGDVVALFTLGTPHVGVPVDVLAELVELLTLGAVTLDEYCVAQPVVCQFSDNEAANPPGFTGIETFNNVHHDRAPGVYYHLLGGDIGFDDRGWLAEILYQLIPGPNDGIVPLPSAMGVSSADDGSGPPLPRLGPLAGVIDRLEVYAAHIESFCDDPSVPLTCDYHYNYHNKDLYCMDALGAVYLDEHLRSEAFFACLEPALNDRLPDHTCGVADELPLRAPRPGRVAARLPAALGELPAGGRAARAVTLPAGPAVLFAHGPLYGDARLAVTLVAPDGQVIDPAYAAAHPAAVRYKGDARAGLYVLADAAPGAWQIVVTAATPTRYRTGGYVNGGRAPATPLPPAPLPSRILPPLAGGPGGSVMSSPSPLPQSESGGGVRAGLAAWPHSCAIDHPGPYRVGDTVHLAFDLEAPEQSYYLEWLDFYFVDAPDGWTVQAQSGPPQGDLGGWGRTVTAQHCPTTTLAYWGLEDPYLAPLPGVCALGAANLPPAGSFNGPWGQYETFAAFPLESFEGAFPPPGWTQYLLGGGSDNHGFQRQNTRVHSGSWAIYHDDDNPWPWDPIDTWLVLPAHTVQGGDTLVFWQNQNYADYYTYHGIGVSTGSPDPDVGDYYVLELGPGTEDTWEEMRVDLSEFSGKTVYVAFIYQGDYSDEWYLDDVAIERLRPRPVPYDFDLTLTVGDDPAYTCPGSPYVGVTSWYSDTRSGLAGVALGDLVQRGVNVAACGAAQPCPLPALLLTATVSLDGVCPGEPAVEVPENDQAVTFCFAVQNVAAVTMTRHALVAPPFGALFSGTLTLGPGEVYALQREGSLGRPAGACETVTGTWVGITPEGLGQPQGAGADVPFVRTVYTAQAAAGAQVCVGDALLVDWAAADYAVGEGARVATVAVALSAPAGRPVTVDYTTADGTATAGADYAAVSGTLVFPPGVTRQTLTVPLLDDALDEPDETAALVLSNPTRADLGPRNPATLLLLDDDGLPTVRFGAADYTVGEAVGPALITVTLSNPYALTVTVDYATADGAALAGSDYLAAAGTLAFAPGVTVRTFAVVILDDAQVEPAETVLLALDNPVNAGLGALADAVLTILDDDVAPAYGVYLPVVCKFGDR